jgi:large subunit ribosomal protein L21
MFAVVNIAGQQFKVRENQYIYVHRLDKEVGETFQVSEVLLTTSDTGTQIGQPFVAGASVSAQVLAHLKGDKIIVFKKKRRKGYRRKKGHRQQYTKVLIQSINA